MFREPARSAQDLVVWQKAHRFVLDVYSTTGGFPKHGVYGLSSQLRRAAVSIPANISEGFRKMGKRDKARYMNIAEGSIGECEYYLILTQDLGYASTENLRAQLEEISKMTRAYAHAILNSNF